MGWLRNKLYRFMYGRNGYDTISKTLLWIYFVIAVSYIVLSLFIVSALFYLLYFLISTSLVIYILWRVMSRNVLKRRAENQKFCAFFKLKQNKWRDRKTHVYRKCPSCKAVLRLPKSRGKHTVLCPRCKNRFETRG